MAFELCVEAAAIDPFSPSYTSANARLMICVRVKCLTAPCAVDPGTDIRCSQTYEARYLSIAHPDTGLDVCCLV